MSVFLVLAETVLGGAEVEGRFCRRGGWNTRCEGIVLLLQRMETIFPPSNGKRAWPKDI